MKTEYKGIEILKNVKSGFSTFSFSVRQENNRFKGTWYTVFIKQVTDMSGISEDPFICTHRIICEYSRSEHAAINYAGKKLIKNWINVN